MAAAARHPIPVILELGGKDAMLVFADADLQRSVNGALYGAFCNSGQVCVAVERLYVEDSLFEVFVERLCEAVAVLKVGHGDQGDLGAISSPHQLSVIEAQYRDALAKGAQASGPLTRDGAYLRPVVLWNVSDDMNIMREETFGPLLPVMSFSDETELVERVKAVDFGLNVSIWSRNIDKARRLAERLPVGNWIVNDVLKNVGHPGLPFGGVGRSGFGRYHGAEGLRSFTYTVSGLVSRARFSREPNWFPYSEQRYRELRAFIDFLFGSGSVLGRIGRNWRELRAFQQYAGLNLGQHWRNFLIFVSRRQH
nr:aldehyde dehydrogenase family protein [Methylomarinum sp. Ch1-1]MDP4519599.1 aldehyde dehydrogenase family protein [Methylomarinum sp. Ch1-1]